MRNSGALVLLNTVFVFSISEDKNAKWREKYLSHIFILYSALQFY